MIKTINVSSLHPFNGSCEEISNLSNVNFIYAPNGSGKTSISNLIKASDTDIVWESGKKIIKVFNRDYLKSTFTSDNSEPGVFQMGEDADSAVEQIEILNRDIAGYRRRLTGKNEAKNKKENEIQQEGEKLIDFIWEQRRTIPEAIRREVVGFGRKDKCREKCVSAIEKINSPAPGDEETSQRNFSTIEELEEKARVIFSDEAQPLEELQYLPATDEFNLNAVYEILSSPLLSASESEYALKVKKNNNFDWVKEGVNDITDNVCPFCFQELPADIRSQIENIIDESYSNKIELLTSSKSLIEGFISDVKSFYEMNRWVDQQFGDLNLSINLENFITKIELFLTEISKKLSHPSSTHEAYWPEEYLEINQIINRANKKIKDFNEMVSSSRELRRNFEDEVWKSFVISRGIKARYTEYLESVTSIQCQIEGINRGIITLRNSLDSKRTELETLKRSLQTSASVAAKINNLLKICNFHSFYIDIDERNNGGYFIVRDEGQRADVNTLSEGERTFITFLYFLQTVEGITIDDPSDKIVVLIDDPISSLDSDVMFTVSMLIRDMIEKVASGNHPTINQIILLTHNTRFHNEVCYKNSSRYPLSYCFYKILKKSPQPNSVENYGQINPIRTSYQELWDQIALAQEDLHGNHPWLPNTMRRIIESYYSTLGGENNLYQIDAEMDFEERIIHNSLIAWSHSGSHTVMDFDSINLQSHSNEKWLSAFRNLFEKTNNSAHYDSMMHRATHYVNSLRSEV
ncbi:AAA family ATPase [Rothia nasimurium]|uniref:AAA family ATPase n=1 Tax=Rothia nasimurium TaxID=85336 RepID=UPI001F189774|nr:AAA family ATPase [Rothia nasimurium]